MDQKIPDGAIPNAVIRFDDVHIYFSRSWLKITSAVVIAIATILLYFIFTLSSPSLEHFHNLSGGVIDMNISIAPNYANNEEKRNETIPAAGNDVGGTSSKFSTTSQKFSGIILQVGPPRTATTLQFQCLCMSLFLKLENSTDRSSHMKCEYISIQELSFSPPDPANPLVIKTHEFPCAGATLDNLQIDKEIMNSMWVFSTAISKDKADGTRARLEQIGFKKVIYVQDMETLAERGNHIVDIYAEIFKLDVTQKNDLLEYIRYWDILRICCGQQMSKKWRMEQWPDSKKGKHFVDVHAPNYPMCSAYNIGEVERLFANTRLYQRIMAKGTLIRKMARPSMNDGEMTGTYCSAYNDLVKNEGVEFNQGDVEKVSSTKNHTQRF